MLPASSWRFDKYMNLIPSDCEELKSRADPAEGEEGDARGEARSRASSLQRRALVRGETPPSRCRSRAFTQPARRRTSSSDANSGACHRARSAASLRRELDALPNMAGPSDRAPRRRRWCGSDRADFGAPRRRAFAARHAGGAARSSARRRPAGRRRRAAIAAEADRSPSSYQLRERRRRRRRRSPAAAHVGMRQRRARRLMTAAREHHVAPPGQWYAARPASSAADGCRLMVPGARPAAHVSRAIVVFAWPVRPRAPIAADVGRQEGRRPPRRGDAAAGAAAGTPPCSSMASADTWSSFLRLRRQRAFAPAAHAAAAGRGMDGTAHPLSLRAPRARG